MKGYVQNIAQATLENTDYRRVLYTGPHLQLVLMALGPGEEIGAETHDGHDQFFRVEQGRARIILGEEEREIGEGEALVVPSGTRHNVINISDGPLKLYTIYAPPEHADGTVHPTKGDAAKH